FYMQGLANVAGQEVAVNYSRSRKRVKTLAGRWGIPESSTDLDRVIARDDIDLFIIALPNEEHHPVARLFSIGDSQPSDLGLQLEPRYRFEWCTEGSLDRWRRYCPIQSRHRLRYSARKS
ncbi:MAG: Gfo/Idh/MocA family oxidoreductase, partial [Bryobacteraceae bacterium]